MMPAWVAAGRLLSLRGLPGGAFDRLLRHQFHVTSFLGFVSGLDTTPRCGFERLGAARRLELVPAALAAYKLLLSAQTRRLTGWLCRFQE